MVLKFCSQHKIRTEEFLIQRIPFRTYCETHSIVVAFRFLRSSWKVRSWSFTNGKEMCLNCWKMSVISLTSFPRLITKNTTIVALVLYLDAMSFLLLMW